MSLRGNFNLLRTTKSTRGRKPRPTICIDVRDAPVSNVNGLTYVDAVKEKAIMGSVVMSGIRNPNQ